jgi:UDP-glucose 4-epimerase
VSEESKTEANHIGTGDSVANGHPGPASAAPAGSEHVVVIGAGFIGSRVATVARDGGHPLVVLSRGAPLEPALADGGVRLVAGDAEDERILARVLTPGAHVVYCAGGRLPAGSVDDPAGDAVETLRPLIRVLEAMREVSNGRITYLSSGGTVYGRPLTEPIDEDHPCRPVVPYGVSRLAAEGYVGAYTATYGIPSRVLRLGNVYGATQPAGRGQGVVAALLDAARKGSEVPVYGDGTVARDYVHVDDVADVVLRLPAPDEGDATLNVATGVARTIREVIDIVQSVTGVTLRLDKRPDRPFDVQRIALSIRRLTDLIPFSPIPLEEGILRAFREQPERVRAAVRGS